MFNGHSNPNQLSISTHACGLLVVTIMVTKRPCVQSIFYRRKGHSNTHKILLVFNGDNLMNICVYINVSLNIPYP